MTVGRRLTLYALILALPGCVTTHTVYCLKHDQALPSEPPKVHDQLTGKADEDVKTLAGSAIRLRAYGGALRGILESCREPD